MEVPVNVIFVFEGDEECGSRGLEEFLAEHRTELAADLVFFSDGPLRWEQREICLFILQLKR